MDGNMTQTWTILLPCNLCLHLIKSYEMDITITYRCGNKVRDIIQAAQGHQLVGGKAQFNVHVLPTVQCYHYIIVFILVNVTIALNPITKMISNTSLLAT